MAGVIADAALQARIDALQAKSLAQEAETHAYFSARAKKGDLSWDGLAADANRFMADKLVALEPIKAEFAYLMCRSLLAKRVVEVGTSFGVSTLYLAAAVRENGGGVVIGTEYEPAKAAFARESFRNAGVADLIDLREGDLRETLKVIEGPVDFVLMDIWTEMARPALELIHPHLRTGAVILADNTDQFRHAYRHFFAFVEDPKNGLKTLTLPFQGGLEMVVKT
jgi:predicted O-methyltransferase YrrM